MAEQPQVPTTASYWPGSTSSPGDSAYKRSGKTKKDLIKCYDTRMQTSRAWREGEYDKTWKRLVDLYKGKQYSGMSSSDRLVVNVAFSTVNVIVPAVAVNYPNVTVGARSPDQEESAYVAEAAVNYWWRRHDWRDEVKRAVKDALIIGHGWVKVGWKYAEKEKPVGVDAKMEQYQQLQGQANDFASQNPHLADQLPSDEEIFDQVPDTQTEVQHDKPTVERVSPWDIYIDPEATYPGDLKWIAQKLVQPLERVQNDDRYKQSARNKLKADMSTNPRWRDDSNSDTKNSDKRNDDIKRVTIYEYWDIEHEFYCVFAKGADDFLLEPTDFPYDFGIPFVPLLNYEVPDQFYPLGDLEMIEPMQHELNAVRTDMMNHRKRWQRAYIAKRDKFDPEAQAVLASDKDGRIAWVDGDDPLNDLILPIQQISLDPQMYQYSDVINNDLQYVSGISEYQRGAAPEIRRTATEASMIQNATNARVSDKLAQVELFMGSIAERVVQLAQQFLSQDEVARIMGPDGKDVWVQFSREDIEGEYDFTVEAGSTTPKDDNFKQSQALQLLQTVQPFIGMPGGIDPTQMITWVLKNAFDIKDPTPFIMQPPPPQPPQPNEKLIESLAYKDAPPDIQRQMEQQAGFQPSQVGGSSPAELAAAGVHGKLAAQEQAAGQALDLHNQQAQDSMLADHVSQAQAADLQAQQQANPTSPDDAAGQSMDSEEQTSQYGQQAQQTQLQQARALAALAQQAKRSGGQ